MDTVSKNRRPRNYRQLTVTADKRFTTVYRVVKRAVILSTGVHPRVRHTFGNDIATRLNCIGSLKPARENGRPHIFQRTVVGHSFQSTPLAVARAAVRIPFVHDPEEKISRLSCDVCVVHGNVRRRPHGHR